MRLSDSRFPVVPLLLLSMSTTFCANGEDSQATQKVPAPLKFLVPPIVGQSSHFQCPNDSQLNRGLSVCVHDEGYVMGPFPAEMTQNCTSQEEDTSLCGTPAESSPTHKWELVQYIKYRGNEKCPKGSWFSVEKGYCLSGEVAYGPFLKGDIERCLKDGKDFCQKMEWPATYLEAKNTKFFCPTGFHYKADEKICVTQGENFGFQEVAGPFSKKMIDLCKDQISDNEQDCYNHSWSLEFYRSFLTGSRCMLGTTYSKAKKYCVDKDGEAYGPFSIEVVKDCLKYGGGDSCLTNRIHSSFIEDTTPPSPPPSKKCKAFMVNKNYNCNTRSLMATIAHAEGTKSSYNLIFTFKKFSSYHDHPRKAYCTRNRKLCSTAAGRYQFLDKTWDYIRRNKRLKNFKPYNQDIAGVYLVQVTRGVKDHGTRYNKRRFAKALYKLRHEWASMPHSPYGQPTHSVKSLWKVYQKGL